ncbi:MAG: tRNA (guanosine(37)-N1)-methyltransferase TrmD [Deltaproteobacteria bacterium RIFCSPLOWO2_12_FULL_43_16]|nr:MAG: tRNA (guanosine(37)-N1)-methyltransferase TrmD [Deltaproteobacteria bacterium GWA2_43_19]OGQ11813.1 MAG: tRNA (guanosine(37)-N1)-methyltransferase TrmD [Deltaproteobacteria bacterium RIFCSPHIGHO2_02_FULL_43_33]OGQ37381.1 MAG: tRNA (guanosine(37)-N1)-methyltransferase TrmD [Deltaproteobacteria bacterium RIFCSPLOWO2_01_FULL_42_9]OGQ60995.1 MAG: tRNA (guanosine(37)-N1)-methyltransferase TrmD [Deltaproteobacteria bacterium RIFCSPLOWO2_12_FULL_43_16]HBR17414.1 tRNA (guanosine(37)-N1)-methylt
MRFDILTIFPDFFGSPLKQSILGKAIEKGLIDVGIHNIRDFALDKHNTTDDSPYGGGDGMVMKVEPIVRAVEAVKGSRKSEVKVILTTPQGRQLNQQIAAELAQSSNLIIICGRYEGVDERVKELVVDMEVSIGDYVLGGGEIPALVIVDAVTRLVPGVLGSDMSARDDSFSEGLLEYPQYTRPESFRGLTVPDILLSGNHQKIKNWRRRESIKRTLERRPDLLEKAQLTEEEKKAIKN